MYTRCPGQDIKNLRVKLYKCPNCGAGVEIFSDELTVKCQKCGTKVYSDRVPSCIDWCASARKCLGEERWQKLKGELGPNLKGEGESHGDKNNAEDR